MAGKKNRAKRDKTTLISPPESARDRYEDEIEGGKGKDEQQGTSEELRVYLPGMELVEGEELQVDPSAYIMLHEMSAEWPCLSFDVISDGGALERTSFPMSGYLVTGTQCGQHHAGRDKKNVQNELYFLRYANLHRTLEKSPDDEEEESDGEDSEDDDGEDDDDENNDRRGEGEMASTKKSPRHYCLTVPHDGAVNRIRSVWTGPSATTGERRLLTASWSDTGRVHLWDLTAEYQELAGIDLHSPSTLTRRPTLGPFASIHCHHAEGYALAWSSSPGASVTRLLSGDCQGVIHLTEVNATGEAVTITASTPFQAHAGSVEDIQWSPSEATVFASSSVDGTVRIWDVRMPRTTAALTGRVHPCDVNVISWNSLTNHLLASGADDGVFATWDLRTWSSLTVSQGGRSGADLSPPTPIYASNWHQGPITSIEWSPHDSTILAVAGADDQVTIWDLSIEESDNNTSTETTNGEESLMTQDGRPVPKQLLFIHQGQSEIKELHWNAHLSGVLLTTALTGFNIFKTISV